MFEQSPNDAQYYGETGETCPALGAGLLAGQGFLLNADLTVTKIAYRLGCSDPVNVVVRPLKR